MLQDTRFIKAGDYSASGDFNKEIGVPNGVIREVVLKLSGTLTGTVTTVNADGLWRFLSDLRITFPRADGPDMIMRIDGRDAYLLSKLFAGRASRVLWPAGASASYSVIRIPVDAGLVRTNRGPARFPGGIDARELSGEVIVEGDWAAAAAYGQTSTGWTNGKLEVSFAIDHAAKPHIARGALLYHVNRIDVDQNAQLDHRLQTGNLYRLAGLFFRSFDYSDSGDADRPDGLITRYRVREANGRFLKDATFLQLQEAMASYFRLPLDELTKSSPQGYLGCCYAALGELAVSKLPDVVNGYLDLELDPSEAVETGVSDVTPASGDRCIVTAVGIQSSRPK